MMALLSLNIGSMYNSDGVIMTPMMLKDMPDLNSLTIRLILYQFTLPQPDVLLLSILLITYTQPLEIGLREARRCFYRP